MSGLASPAVMARRREPHDSLDDFPTPCWATRALCAHVIFRIGKPVLNANCPETVIYRHAPGTFDLVCPDGALVPPCFPVAGLTAWEPAANRGFMARALADYFGEVHATDIHDYGYGGMRRQVDFLFPGSEAGIGQPIDWIITNPPFRLAEAFILRALALKPRGGVAVIVRTAFLEGVRRHRSLFAARPPTVIAQFAERVPMVKGRVDAAVTTATAYCWLVWQTVDEGRATRFAWIPPCRRELEQEGDYVA